MSLHVGQSLVEHRLLFLSRRSHCILHLVCDRSFLTAPVALLDASEEHGEDDDTGDDGASNEDVDPCVRVVIIRVSGVRARLVRFVRFVRLVRCEGYGAVFVSDSI